MGGAESFGAAGLMYLVFVVDLASLDQEDEEAMDVVGQAASQVRGEVLVRGEERRGGRASVCCC